MSKIQSNKVIISNYLNRFLPEAKWYTSDIIQYQNKGKLYYLVFEGPSIYTSFESQNKLNNDLALLEKIKLSWDTQITRIPFFAGCTNQELSLYLGIHLKPKLNIKINFSVLPVDFNVPGLECYYSYLSQLFNYPQSVIGENNKNNYYTYWTGDIEKSSSMVYNFITNYLLDKDITQAENKQFLLPYIKELKELLGDKHDNRK